MFLFLVYASFSLVGEELKKKWKNLRDSYAKHLRSLKTTTGQSAQKKLYKWQWAKQMETFRPFMSFAKTESNIAEVTGEENTDGESMTADINRSEPSQSPLSSRTPQDEFTLDIEQNVACTQEEGGSSSRQTPVSLPKNSRRTNSNKRIKAVEETESPTEKVITYLKDKHSSCKNKTAEMDAIDLIFAGYAKTIKKFSPQMQINAKLKLAQVMSELELQHEVEAAGSSASHPSTRCSSRGTAELLTPLRSPTSIDSSNSASIQYHGIAYGITDSSSLTTYFNDYNPNSAV